VLALSHRRRLYGDVAIGGRGAELVDEVEDGLGQCGESLGAHTLRNDVAATWRQATRPPTW